MLFITNSSCITCDSEIYQKQDSLIRLILMGGTGVKAFPRYYCPNCGKIKYKDLPIELRKRAFRSRIVYLVFAVIFIVLLILYK